MSQIKKINIKGVEYDLAGSGNSTSDTAYVDNKTLYIEEGTTAGGGSDLIIDMTSSELEDGSPSLDFLEALIFGTPAETSFVPENQMFKVETAEFSIDADIYNKILNNDITTIRIRVEVDGKVAISQLYSLNMNYPLFVQGAAAKVFSSVPNSKIFTPILLSCQIFIEVNSYNANSLTITLQVIKSVNP